MSCSIQNVTPSEYIIYSRLDRQLPPFTYIVLSTSHTTSRIWWPGVHGQWFLDLSHQIIKHYRKFKKWPVILWQVIFWQILEPLLRMNYHTIFYCKNPCVLYYHTWVISTKENYEMSDNEITQDILKTLIIFRKYILDVYPSPIIDMPLTKSIAQTNRHRAFKTLNWELNISKWTIRPECIYTKFKKIN